MAVTYKYIVQFFFFIACSSSLFATNIDSLRNLLPTVNSNDKFNILLDLAWADDLDLEIRNKYANDAYNLAFKQGDNEFKLEALKILSSLSWQLQDTTIENNFKQLSYFSLLNNDYQTAGAAYNTLGLFFQKKPAYDSSILYYQKAIEMFDSANSKGNKAQAMVNLGIIYKNIGFYTDAVSITLSGITISVEVEDNQNLAAAYNNLGNTFKELKNYNEAEFYLKKALEIRLKYNNKRAIAGVLNNLGNVYRYWGKLDIALKNYYEALTLKQEIGNKILLASTIDNIGEVFILKKQYANAKKYFKDALQKRTEERDLLGITTSNNRIAYLYFSLKNYDSAFLYAIAALTIGREINSRKDILKSYELLKNIENKRGNYKQALLFASDYNALKDSLYSEEKAKIISNAEVKHRTEKYIRDLSISLEKERTQKIKIKNQNLVIIILLIAFISIFVITLLILRAYQVKKKARNTEKLLRREIQHRVKNNLQLISNMHYLQMEQTTDSSIKNLITENEQRLQAINMVHQTLWRGNTKNELNFKVYILNLIEDIRTAFANQATNINQRYDIDELYFSADIANSIGLILNELLTNAFKYAFKNKSEVDLEISLKQKSKDYLLQLSHSGDLWDYDKLKNKKGSFGISLVDMLIKQISGEIKVEITNTLTLYTIQIPIKNQF